MSGTFDFVVLPHLTDKEKIKAEYTFHTVLKLNDSEREPIRQARENAYENFTARLFEYVEKKRSGASAVKLQKMIKGIQNECHPTVWKEMQRYHREGWLRNIDEDLDDLFLAAAPDGVLNW